MGVNAVRKRWIGGLFVDRGVLGIGDTDLGERFGSGVLRRDRNGTGMLWIKGFLCDCGRVSTGRSSYVERKWDSADFNDESM